MQNDRNREKDIERALRFSKKKYANRVFTNANKYLLNEKYKVLHCKKCTNFVLITDAEIDKVPRRRTDNAVILTVDSHMIKLYTNPLPDPVKVNRQKGIETQYLHACRECGHHVLYQSTPHEKEAKILYVIETNVTFPHFTWAPRQRCTICGFIPRNDEQFEEHKRDRGHMDQSEGTFPAFEEKNDTPVNPLIVG